MKTASKICDQLGLKVGICTGQSRLSAEVGSKLHILIGTRGAVMRYEHSLKLLHQDYKCGQIRQNVSFGHKGDSNITQKPLELKYVIVDDPERFDEKKAVDFAQQLGADVVRHCFGGEELDFWGAKALWADAEAFEADAVRE